MFIDIWLLVCSTSAIWLVGRLDHWKKWGYVFGLLSQPAWFYTAIMNKQWSIVALSVWYTIAWARGCYNYWIKAS